MEDMRFIQCRACLGKNGRFEKGYILVNKDGQDFLKECQCHKNWRKMVEVCQKASKANLNPDLREYNPDRDYMGNKDEDTSVYRLKTFVQRSVDSKENPHVKQKLKASSIYMYGKNGVQKTTLANWMGYEFLRNGKKVYYCLMNTLLKELQQADRDEEIRAKLDRIADVDLLILDEAFDKDKVTIYRSNFQIPYLDTFLRQRLQTNHKGIIFISNVPIDEIESNGFNKSIEDLVIRNVDAFNGRMEFVDNYNDLKGECNEETLF